jgi:hypothetical protein
MRRAIKTRSWARGVACLVTGICLLAVVCTAPALASKSSKSQSASALPPSVLPVIVLQGSDYDMGYQYYQQVDQLFGPSILQNMQVPAGFTAEQLTALKAYESYVQQYTPEYIDMFKGMAAAATNAGVPLSYMEVLANFVGTTAYPSSGASASPATTHAPTCSAWAAWGRTTKNGSLITGQEMDPPWGDFGDANYVAIAAYPATGNAYVNIAQPGQLASIPVFPGINNKGVATSGNAGEGWRDIDTGAGAYRVKAGLIPHILRFSDSAAAAKDLWLSYRQPDSWNMTISDVKGNAFVVESTGAFQKVRKPGDFGEGDFIYSRNTYFTRVGGTANLNGLPGKFYRHGGWAINPQMAAPVDSMSDVQLASVRTNQTMYNMLHQYAGHVNVNFAKMLFRHHGKIPLNPWNLKEYRATKAKYYGNPGNLNAAFVTIGKPANGDGGVMYICTGPAGRVGLPYEAGPWDDTYQVAGTHTFYALALAGNPDALVGAAEFAAEHDIARAYQKLMWLNYRDVGFEGLNSLYSDANSEYFEGFDWASKAGGATGNEKLLDTAKAATCFAKAQAHAQQVYEALVRPAVTPSGLGLKAYVWHAYGF